MHLSTRTYLNGLVIYPRVASFLAVQVGVGFVRMTGVYECACRVVRAVCNCAHTRPVQCTIVRLYARSW